MDKMIKVLIVEDEMLLLQGLKRLVDWQALGFTLCETVTNYMDAVSAAYLHKPDLLLTDIMLGEGQKDGLELVHELGALLPEMQAVLLTGYDRFEYAERAIEYNVRAYLLKPVDAQALTDCLIKVRETYNSRQEMLNQRQRLTEQLRTAQPFLFDWFLNCGTQDLQWRQFFGLTGKERCWQIVTLAFQASMDSSYIAFLRLEYLREGRQNNTLAFYRQDHIIYVLRSEERLEGDANELVNLLTRYCNFNGLSDAVVGVGCEVQEFSGITRSYEEAILACRHGSFYERGNCVYYSDLTLPSDASVTGFITQREKLQFAVRIGRTEEVEQTIRKTLYQAGTTGASIESLRSMGIEALVLLNEVLLESHLPAIDHRVWEQTLHCRNMEQLCSLLTESYMQSAKALKERRHSHNQSVLESVHHMVETEYAKPLTLEYAAKLVYLSPAYLGTLFQNTYGLSFKDFLTDTRIKAACELLRSSGKKVYEIAEAVGYTDSRYFSQVFRKSVGMTPLEYRAANQK